MISSRQNKLTASLAAIALALSVGLIAPAEASTRANTTQSSTSTAVGSVWVTQTGGPGSVFGLLEWTPVAGATQYTIQKTGSIRPQWRLFFVAPASMTKLEVVDKPGAIAVYRVWATVSSREVLVGRFNYRPKR
jgi:hypothetical protein